MGAILAAIAIPLRVSALPNPRRGIWRTLIFVSMFNIVWGLLIVSFSEIYANF